MSFPFIQQLDRMDCGPVCLQIIAQYYKRSIDITHLRTVADMGKDGTSMLGLKKASESIGFIATGINIDIDDIINNDVLPLIIPWNQNHFVIIYKLSNKSKHKFYISDPSKGKYIVTEKELRQAWYGSNSSTAKGVALYLEVTDAFLENNPKYFKQSFLPQLNKIFSILYDFKKFYFNIILGIFISLIIQVALPLISKSFFDFAINGKNYNLIGVFVLSQFALLILGALVSYYRNWIVLYVGSRINISILYSHLTKLLSLDFSYFDQKNSGDIIQRINDNSRIEDFLTTRTVSVILSIINLFVFQVVLLIFNHKLSIIFNIGFGLYAIWTHVLLKKINLLDFNRFDSASKNQSFIMQLVNGVQDLKLNNAILKRVQEWRSLREDLFSFNQEFILLKQLQEFGSLIIINAFSMAITYRIAISVADKAMTIGELIAVQYIMAQLISPIGDIVAFFKSYNDAKLSLARLDEVNSFSSEDEFNEHTEYYKISDDIVFENVSFIYPGSNGKLSVSNLSVTILKGKINAVVGESGSGKTTLAKLLLKMYKPTSGCVTIAGQNLEQINSNVWRECISSVMQEGFIFSDTILNNIILQGGEVNQQKLKYALLVSNLTTFVAELPHGIYTKIGMDGSGISQGQKQRILIARCVYKDPQLIIFDEATNALDTINETIIYDNLVKYYRDKTVVTIAHRLSTIVNADQIIVFDKGSIVEVGNHNDLMNIKGIYFKLVMKQQLNNIPFNILS